MSREYNPPKELVEAVRAVVDGTPTSEQHERLDAALKDDAAARDFFVEMIQLHATLQGRAIELFVGAAETDDDAISSSCGLTDNKGHGAASVGNHHGSRWSATRYLARSSRPSSLLVACACAALLLASVWIAGFKDSRSPVSAADESGANAVVESTTSFVGVVREARNTQMAGDAVRPSVGALMPAAASHLVNGSLVIETFDGALITLNAPCEVSFESSKKLVCRSGRVAVDVVGPDCQLTVQTPVGELLHIGTEYQVAVDPATGETRLEVYDGGVQLQSAVLAAAPDSARVFHDGASVRMRPTGEIAKLHQAMTPVSDAPGLLPERPVPYISDEGYTVRTVLAPGDNYHPPEPGETDAPRLFTIAAAEELFQDGVDRGDVVESAGIRLLDFQDGYAKPQYAEVLASYVNLFDFDARPPAFAEGSEPRNCFVLHIHAKLIVERSWAYSFVVNSDDGCRLRVDGVDVVVDNGVHPPQLSVGTIALAAGEHDLDLIAYEDHGFHRLEVGVAQGRTRKVERFVPLACRE